jgi:phosphonate transport system substrate-binding protein
MNKFTKTLLFTLGFAVLMTAGCTETETPKKVSLYKRSGDITGQTRLPKQNTLWFGFDLRLGPKEEVTIYTPFLKYLEQKTGRRFRIKFTKKYEDTVDNLGTGITDFAAIGSLSFVKGKETYGINNLVSGVNHEGDTTYRAMIITGQNSGIDNIREIRGRCFAFGSEMSTQGHLIPRKILEDNGITLDKLSKHIYTGSHLNAAMSVINGECDAAGVQDVLAKRLESEGKIRIIKRSEPFPSSLIAYNSAVDKLMVKEVKAALLAFDPMGKHKEMLVDWDKTEMPLGFTEINELEFNKVKILAEKYGLMEK